MAYNEILAQRVRDMLAHRSDVSEKKMMGGLCFMVDDKMCVGISRDDLMVRIGADQRPAALSRKGCREMDFTGRPMKAFVFVGTDGTEDSDELRYWVELALEFNPFAKSSKGK